MPIISNFPSGGGSGGGGLQLAAVSGIVTKVSHGKVYVKWTDPEDLVVAESTLAEWAGTLLVRKAGSMPVSRRDGTVVVDSKVRNQYQNQYFCDSGLTDGTVYYYKFFPYTTTNTYTENEDCEFTATPNAPTMGNVSGMSATPAGNGKLAIKWTDPAATIVDDGLTLATWEKTVVVVKEGGYATSPDDEDAAYSYTSTTRNAHASVPLTVTGLTNGTTYYVSFFPVSTDGAVNVNASNRITNAEFVSEVLNENSWAVIKAVSDSGQGDNYWDVGDTKNIKINGKVGSTTFNNLSVDVFIIGFNHNSSREGSNRIHFQIGKIGGKLVGLIDSKYSPDNGWSSGSSGNFVMNTSNTNSGGWNNSYMRKTILGNTNTPTSPLANSLMAALPADLRAVMKSVSKYTDNTGNASNVSGNVTKTTDYLFLLAEYEVQGARTYANQYEKDFQQKYTYYSSGNQRIAYKYNATGTAVYWWLRSANYSSGGSFCYVYTDGSAGVNFATCSLALLPGFAV